MESEEIQYITLLSKVLETGQEHTSRNATTKSIFNANLEFDLSKGFPLMTHKKMFFKGIVEELLFFIRGDTNTKMLEEKGVYIWKGNTSKEFLDKMGFGYKEGLMGPNYGYNWRNFGSMYNTENGTPLHAGIDQLKNVVDTIKRDPYSRRILLTSYDPMTVSQCVLYPCHTVIAQFHVSSEDILSMFCYIRSSDLLLGLPFNIASSALLLMLIAKITDKIPGKLYITLGDAHVYTAHLDAARLACSRRYSLYNFPIIGLPDVKTLEDIEKLTHSDISLHWYESHGAISAPMIP